MQTERNDTNPVIALEDLSLLKPPGCVPITEPLGALRASDAFVVPWDPRALDCGQ